MVACGSDLWRDKQLVKLVLGLELQGINMRAPTFTVVIPTHNRKDLLKRALQSVNRQTTHDYEIVVVDDASSDGTQAFLTEISSDRCRVFRNHLNLGVSASRNRGAAAARGEFIVFLDDDDQLRSQTLQRLSEEHSANPELDFFWGGRAIHRKDAAGHHISSRFDDWSTLPRPIRGSQFLAVALDIATNTAFTIRRSVFDALGGFDPQLKVSEDRDLFVRLARGGYSGNPVTHIAIDVDEHLNATLSRNTGIPIGPFMDLTVIQKHRDYLEDPKHREFLNRYLQEIFCGFLRAGNHVSAARIAADLCGRRALNIHMLRMYWRNAPEFRLLKRLLRYDRIRRFLGGNDLPVNMRSEKSAPARDLDSKR